jgi:SAM-dependent methyltransferase
MQHLRKIGLKLKLLRGVLGVGSLDFLNKPGFPLQYREVEEGAEIFRSCVDSYQVRRPWSSLDLGCGGRPGNPFSAELVSGVDLVASPDGNVVAADLALMPIPFKAGEFDFVTGSNFFEHVPRVSLSDRTRFPFVELIDEIFRVLKPGGLLYSCTPAFPSKWAFQDPTHVNIITEDTWPLYFCTHAHPDAPWARRYGYRGTFKLLDQAWCKGHLLTVMRKSSGSYSLGSP